MSLSLQKNVRTCKYQRGEAPRYQSDRFLNTNLLLCPTWSGSDSEGRAVCADSFVTKSAGCNSSSDRIWVENDLRPEYFSEAALSAQGIQGALYGMIQENYLQGCRKASQLGSGSRSQQAGSRAGWLTESAPSTMGTSPVVGSEGQGCYLTPYADITAAEQLRAANTLYNAFTAQKYRALSGFT